MLENRSSISTTEGSERARLDCRLGYRLVLTRYNIIINRAVSLYSCIPNFEG